MIFVVAALIGCGWWVMLTHTARVDDAIANEAKSLWPDMRVDINRAAVAELSLLPGLGDRLAQRIVADREANGRFSAIADLERVPGLGPATIDRLRPYACVQDP